MLIIPSVRIYRVEESFRGTFSALTICDKAFCVCLEPPDAQNIRNISSIPDSQYLCKRVESPQFGETFEVTNVSGRSHILFHAGNFVEDTRGCIVLAQHFGKLDGDRAVLNSGKTFKKFMDVFKNINQFSLTIREVF